MKKTELYRVFSEGGDLLYVGISNMALRRIKDHKRYSKWFDGSLVIKVEAFETRADAEISERDAIKKENPKFNITHAKKENLMPAGEKTSGLTLSVTDDERDIIRVLCEKDGRSRKGEIMWLVNRRLAELENTKNEQGK